MTDLTDKRPMLILARPDVKTKTAIDSEVDKWQEDEKATITYSGEWLISEADPLGAMDEKRAAIVDLIDANAESATDVLFVLPGDGHTIKSTGLIVRRLNDPEDEK